MSDQPPQRHILSRKTTHSLLFVGAIGWTAFFLTTAVWKRSDNKRKKSMSELEGKINNLSSQLSQESENSDKKTSSLNQLTDKLGNLKNILETQQNKAQQELKLEIAKTSAETAKFRHHLDQALIKINSNKNTKVDLDFWAQAVKSNSNLKQDFKNRFHSSLAEHYFKLGAVEETKLQLKLSNNFDAKQSARLLGQLDMELALSAVTKAIQSKAPEETVQEKLKTAHGLAKELAKDPSKKSAADAITARLLRLESRHALNLPPKQALTGMLLALKKQQSLTEPKNAPIELCVSYVQASLDTLLISQALNNKTHTGPLKKQTSEAIARVLKKAPNNKQAYAAKAILELMELDQIFMDADASTISKKTSQLKATARKADKATNLVITSAAAGHQASVSYEKGKTTEASSILNKAIQSLMKYTSQHKDDTLAQFRLGILYWHQAQLTTSSDRTFLSLNNSEKTLKATLTSGAKLHEHAIRQFLAMVQGDLGHLEAANGKKATAKKHFQSAVTNWKVIEKNWGQTVETKEGIRYCSWRMKQL